MFAYMAKQRKNKFFKSRDDMVSMFLGLVVVVAVVGFIVNFIEKRKGNIDIPGVKSDLKMGEKNEQKQGSNNLVTVKKGDSLWKIAVERYNDGYKWTEIAKANNLNNPGLIFDGQELVLPEIGVIKAEEIINDGKGGVISTIGQEQIEYKVVLGDSLWKIAESFYKDGNKWTEIWQDNRGKLNSPDKLEIGMILVVRDKITE
jgi:nucleoid-associated protein YgaU